MEHLVAWAYRFAGSEQLWIPRMFSVTFWLLGGLFLYMLTSEMTSPPGALICVAFYLFAPFGIFMSRSFQPEAMMVMLFIASILTIRRYYNRPSIMRLLVAAGVTVLAIFSQVHSGVSDSGGVPLCRRRQRRIAQRIA